jgi:uncharacterized protein with GYD domain
MTTFITQARFTKDGLNATIAAPEDRTELAGRLIAEVGGKLVAYYLTSGEYVCLSLRGHRMRIRYLHLLLRLPGTALLP